ncbi:BPTD_3080 family restriction endonuclease [Ekhidna sp.]|uniref:BPTD_3080 family restriction endonuclease n=1 Tax=Ekhidna sp. TaxID=2608089 RepID=UPI003514DCA4
MRQIDQLIICSPFREPDKHWKQDKESQEFYQEDGRRPAGYNIAAGASGGEDTGRFIELELANTIRKRVSEWQDKGRPGLTGVSRELLNHWYNLTEPYRFFFCQLEAIETIIFLNEAPAHYTNGIEIPGDGGPFERWCSKMATGSGKTIIMAMLVAYNVLNKVAYRQDNRFSKYILVVAPGLTVKSRLSVLDPSDEDNYYKAFQIVPTGMMEKLHEGKIRIINWHLLAWDTQEKLNEKASKGQLRSVDKRKRMEISDTAYAKQVLGEMANANNLLVLNDEAHHAWRSAAESKVKGVSKDEIDNTVWVGGLDKLNTKVPILRCHDLSATPFAPTGKKTTGAGLFEWIISDFGLNDAIESGLVKTPRVVLRDDGKLTSEYKSRLYHIYMDKDVKDDINQKQIPKETQLPDLVINAYNLLATDWLKTKNEWSKHKIQIPPAMITVANTTVTADRIKYFFDSGGCSIKEICELDKTLQIDSKILGKIENEDDTLKGSQAEMAKELRDKVDSVGKIGEPGEQIQNVISVGMLSEGWDAKNVTQIMGLRAFSSQLLCEQVVGRGLRRVSYEFDENDMLSPEYVNIFGVPFSFIPHEGGGTAPRPPKPVYKIEPSPDKEDHRIVFPNILRVDTIYQSRLVLDYNQIKQISIDPSDTITQVDLGGVIENNVTPAALTDVALGNYGERFRLQSVIFHVATKIFNLEKPNWKGNQYDFLAQLFKLTEEFIRSDKIVITSKVFNDDPTKRSILITLNLYRIIQHFWVAIKDQNAAVLSPVFDKEKPVRSTSDMPTWYTSKPNEWHKRSHVSHTVFDSTWEANNAKILDTHPSVKSFIKNDHLGFVIKYQFKGVIRNYYPDYIIQMTNDEYLVLEVKGQDNDENRAKRDFLNLWVKAVNQNGQYGKWNWAVVFNSDEIRDILNTYKEFPTEAFRPVDSIKSESEAEITDAEILEINSSKLASFYAVPIEELRKEKSLDAMVNRVIKAMLSKNIESIFNTVKEASKESGEDFIDQEEFQEKIYSKLDGISVSEKKVFDGRVRNMIKDAKFLKKQSFDFLLSAEHLNDTIVTQMIDDYSPYVLQMSRAVESELLLNVFEPFTVHIRTIHPRVEEVYTYEFNNKDFKSMAEMLSQNRTNYTLGAMHHFLRKAGYPDFSNSQLGQDFYEFTVESFDKALFEADFLDDVIELIKTYRNKSAHVDVLTKEQAQDCRHLIKKILTKFLGMKR